MSVVKLDRRRILRGMLNGSAVTVALPFLECFLNSNGTALASGQELPVRFGTWFWGLGVTDAIYKPSKFGSDYELKEQTASFKDLKKYINIYSNFDVLTDGKPNFCHFTGWVGLRTGEVPGTREGLARESLDVTVADVIGTSSRFPIISLAATGNPRTSLSFRNADAINPPDVSPVDLYTRIFGPDFQDPNSPNFTPDPRIMTRKSVLSGVAEHSAQLRRTLSTSDQARLDEYFTATRSLENRLALQLEKPAPAEACKVPGPIEKEAQPGIDYEVLSSRHNLMADTLVMAVACNQTRVFNMVYSEASALTTRKGAPRPHHPQTHEEAVDLKLGYQPGAAWFSTRAMESFAYLVGALAKIKEGDGTLLDRTLVWAHSDTNLAQIHTLTGMPMLTAGSAGGRMKTGIHVDGQGGPGSRVGLTCMQAMGVQITEWGVNSMKTNRPVSEVLA